LTKTNYFLEVNLVKKISNIEIISGNIFDTEMQTITITVNCVGVMGKGIALEMKKRCKPAYENYQNLCENKDMQMGEPVIYDDEEVLKDKNILFFPTKFDWRNKSELFQIKKGLEYFAKNYDEMGVESIAFPALGCSNGGLNWSDVKPVMYEFLEGLDIEIKIYEPGEQTEKNLSGKQTEKKSNPEPSKITDYC